MGRTRRPRINLRRIRTQRRAGARRRLRADPACNKELRTLNDYVDYLNWLSESDDPEGAHYEADDALLKVIGLVADTATESVATTLRAIVAYYKEVPKYYA